MPILKVARGGPVGREMPVNGARVILGRHPQCEIVLDHAAVSRQHAQILRVGDDYFVEDLSSRNGTFLDGHQVEGRVAMLDGASLQISDLVLEFQVGSASEEFRSVDSGGSIPVDLKPGVKQPAADSPIQVDSEMIDAIDESRLYIPQVDGPAVKAAQEGKQAPDLESSSILHKLNANSSDLYGGQKDAGSSARTKLKAVLDITRALARVINIDEVLPRTLETLFRIFPHAEQGFILLQDPRTLKLKVKASRTRTALPADAVAVSMTIVRKAMTTGEALLSANALDDSRFQASTSLSQLRIRSIMCVPLVTQEGRAIGVIQIDTKEVGQEFREGDLELLASVAAQAAMAVENAQMHEAQLAQREAERDLDFARQVQRGFLPNERPRVEGYSFSDYYEPAKSVGGDYYDYIRLPDGRIAVVLGDVAGKGVSAALLMARLYSSARFQFLSHPDPGDAVTHLNTDIFDSGVGTRFITFVAMVLDATNNKVTLANAGHMPPLLRQPDGSAGPIGAEVSSLPLGIIPDQKYSSMTFDFPAGAAMIAFTDGITETMNADRDLYGRDRLLKTFEGAEGDIGDVIRAVIADVADFSTEDIDGDDTCLVGFRRRA